MTAMSSGLGTPAFEAPASCGRNMDAGTAPCLPNRCSSRHPSISPTDPPKYDGVPARCRPSFPRAKHERTAMEAPEARQSTATNPFGLPGAGFPKRTLGTSGGKTSTYRGNPTLKLTAMRRALGAGGTSCPGHPAANCFEKFVFPVFFHFATAVLLSPPPDPSRTVPF